MSTFIKLHLLSLLSVNGQVKDMDYVTVDFYVFALLF